MQRQKKIALISITDKLGGAEQIIFNIAKYWQEKDHIQVHILFLQPKSNDFWDKEFTGNISITYLRNLYSLYSIFRANQFQLVYSTHLMINAFLGFSRTFSFLKTTHLVVRESTLVFGRYRGIKLFKYNLAYYLGYHNVDLVIAQTQEMADALKHNIPFLFQRTQVVAIPNPFEAPSAKWQQELLLLKSNSIVAAGRLIPEKGFDILIRTFSAIAKNQPCMQLIILGEGPERQRLEKLVNDLNLIGKVVLKGFVENVYPYFRQARICVVSSLIEGFPNVLLQMMSQNDNVVSTKCAGGIAAINGLYTAEVNNVASLQEAVEKCLSTNNNYTRNYFDNFLLNRTTSHFIKQINSRLL